MTSASTRRRLLIRALRLSAASAALALQRVVQAAAELWTRDWNESAFSVRGLTETLAALGWAGAAQEDGEVHLLAPAIAESGAVVPVEVSSTLAGIRRIAILVLDNPNTLAAEFRIFGPLEPRIATRIKLAETTSVVALVETGAGIRMARKVVKVTAGGCGG